MCRLMPRALVLSVLIGAIALQTFAQSNSFQSAAQRFERDTERVHDPSTIVKCNEEYWVFSTGPGISSRHSTNLLNWTNGPRVFVTPPAWTTNTIPGNRGYFWAPDVIHLKDGYFLYYSVSTWGKNNSAIALATNPTLDPAARDFGWIDHGIVVRTTGAEDYNAIDPATMLDDDGRLWMVFGSYWSGIKLVELDAQTGLRKMGDSPLYSLAYNKSIEAACLCRHGAHYYLFVNWGLCCRGTNSTYEIRVGRSDKVMGPYLDDQGNNLRNGGGTLFLASAGKRSGPGHAAVFHANGREFVSWHYYNAEQSGRPRLQIAPLTWTSDGWPKAGSPLDE